MDFTERNRTRELMDDPNIEAGVLKKVLKDINRTNHLLNGNKPTIKAIENLLRATPKESYTIIDVGCGDGAMLRQLVKWSRKRKCNVQCIGIDLSKKALSIAAKESTEFPEIKYIQQNILDDEFSQNYECDIVLCTLTMHHFYNEHIPVFLERFVNMARIGVVINDLQRSPLAYSLFKVFSLIFIRTDVAKKDGLLSIRSGFTKNELKWFSKKIINVTHDIKWRWAFRYVWVIDTERLTKSYA